MKGIKNKIIRFYSTGFEKFKDRSLLSEFFLANIVNFTGIIFLLLLSLICFYSGQLTTALITSAATLTLFLNKLFFKRTHKIKIHAIVFLSVIVLLELISFFRIIPESFFLLGLLTFPISIILLNIRTGIIISFIHTVLIPFILFFLFKNQILLFFSSTFHFCFFTLLCLMECFLLAVLFIHRHQMFYEMSRIIRTLNKMNKEKDESISNISHQIRTPLSSIMVLGNLLEDTDPNEKQKELIGTLKDSAINITHAVSGMSKLSKSDFQNTIDNIRFNIHGLINNVIDILNKQYSKTIHYNINISEKFRHTVQGDPIKLKQILLNIIENIICNSTLENLSVDINVTFKEKENPFIYLLFEIRCYGSKDIINKDELLSKKCDYEISKQILEDTGSNLNITTTDNQVIYSFTMSYTKIHQENLHDKIIKLTTKPKQKKINKVQLKEAKVLLAEDNLLNQKLAILGLKKFVKTVDVANNGKEALEKFSKTKYDLILMDVQMPVMDGITTARKIRDDEMTSDTQIPIIAITANAMLGDKDSCLAAGMNDYISKPFQIDILIQKMRDLLE